ncbi:MAG: amino acid permease [Candidatus Methanoperedens sp.]
MTSPFKSITLCALTVHLPNILSIVHISRRTPWAAILMTSVLSMLFIFAGDIAFVANVANFTLFITFFVINAAMIVLRYKEPDVKRPFRVPVTIGKFPLIPFLGMLFNIFMLLQLEANVILVGTALVVVGGLLSFVEWKR